MFCPVLMSLELEDSNCNNFKTSLAKLCIIFIVIIAKYLNVRLSFETTPTQGCGEEKE